MIGQACLSSKILGQGVELIRSVVLGGKEEAVSRRRDCAWQAGQDWGRLGDWPAARKQRRHCQGQLPPPLPPCPLLASPPPPSPLLASTPPLLQASEPAPHFLQVGFQIEVSMELISFVQGQDLSSSQYFNYIILLLLFQRKLLPLKSLSAA